MKQLFILAAALLLAVSCSQNKAPKVLVLYYSQTNTTKVVAEEIAAALVVRAIPFGDFSPLLIVLLSGLLCYGLSNLISHSATAALLMPILVVVCTAMGDKLAAVGGTSTVLIGVAIASSSAMILPISTPPNALAYATNMIQQKDMARMGVIIGLISIVLGYLVLFAAGSLHIV